MTAQAMQPARVARSYREHERAILGTLSVVGFFVVWEIAARAALISDFFLGSPMGIIDAAIEEVQLPRFWRDVGVSLLEFSTGYLAAVVLGVSIGITLGW